MKHICVSILMANMDYEVSHDSVTKKIIPMKYKEHLCLTGACHHQPNKYLCLRGYKFLK